MKTNKEKLTNKDIFRIHNNLVKIKGLKGAKLNYAIVRNISKLKPEVEALNKLQEFKPDYVEFVKERVELAKSHAKLDEDGKPKTKVQMIDGSPQSHYDIKDNDKFDKDLKKLETKHKKAIDNRNEQLKEMDEILKEENNIELYKVSLEEIPDEVTTEQMAKLELIIE